ncbi:MAG TPA: DUF885 domain-containing protein [Chitinophagaceae bacterium]|nr:DUF885 domain-containing protein [Chitinophagaceae bacterium]
MKGVLIFIGVITCILPCGCKAQNSFTAFENKFVKQYGQLNILQLQLSYVDNLQQLPDGNNLNKQEDFFAQSLAGLKAFSPSRLTPQQQTDYSLIEYESRLMLGMLKIDKQWQPLKPAAIPATGLYTLPLGKEWYAWFLKRWVGDDVTPDEIYAFGLQQVEEVKKHIDSIRMQTGMDEDKFYAYLEDVSFFTADHNAVQAAFEQVKDTVLHNLHRLFTNTDIPAVAIRRGTNNALAQAPGYYSDNTFYYNLFDKPYNTRQYNWLFIHEAVPGHHYQHSIAAALHRTPVQNLFSYMGYSEGWGAYAEYLGKDLGLYKTWYDELGKWEWDIVRSVRLPMDVGINYYGWTDAQALAFWKKNIRGQDDIAMREINRIKRWPAQVVTYKYGAAKFLQWRQQLQQQQGARFDIKAFHDKVLNSGPLPFFILQKIVLG